MEYTVTSESPFVLPEDTASEGTSEGKQIDVNPIPRVTISGGNARLLSA